MKDARSRLKLLNSPELVEALDELFPDRSPDSATSDRQVWIDAGSVKVVRLLKALLEEVIEDTLLLNTQET